MEKGREAGRDGGKEGGREGGREKRREGEGGAVLCDYISQTVRNEKGLGTLGRV